MKSVGLGRIGAVLVLVVSLTAAANATTFVLMNEEQLVARSTAAVLGSVTEIETAPDPETGIIHTYVHIEPSESIFGNLPAGEVVLRERGGSFEGIREWVFGNPEYSLGEEVLVFVTPAADGVLHTTGMSMGKYAVRSGTSGRVTVRRELGEGTRVLQPSTGLLLSEPPAEERDLDEFAASVRRAARSERHHGRRGRRPAPRLAPPELAETSVREWQESFTFLGTPSRWFEPDDGAAVGFLIDQTGDVGLGPVSSRAAIDAAFAAWSGVASSSLQLADNGLTGPLAYTGCTSTNRVAFNDPYGEIDDPVDCAGVLAIGGYCSSGSTRVVNGTTFRRIVNGKVMFNNGWTGCWSWNQCNVAEVATHELGHTLGLGHSSDSSATMAAYAHFDGRCAGLKADDIAAVAFMYPSVSGPTATMTPSPTKTTTSPPTATSTPSVPPTPTSTFTQVPTQTQTAVPTPTPTATTRPTPTDRPTATSRPTSTQRPTATSTVPPSATAATTATFTAVPPETSTPTPSATPTSTPTDTSTPAVGMGHRLSGRVRYYSSGVGVPGVTVRLSGTSDLMTETTDSGSYALDGIPTDTWRLEPQGMTGGPAAVSALDAAYVLQAVVGNRHLTATQQLACDVTGNGTVSSLDAARILQYTVGSIAALPVSSSCQSAWLFAPIAEAGGTQQFQPGVSSGNCRNGWVLLDPLDSDLDGQDFDALRFGDCTGNWKPADSDTPVGPAEDAQPMVQLGRLRRSTGSTMRLPIYIRPTNPIQAVAVHLTYDPARLEPIKVTTRRPSKETQFQFHVQVPGQLAVAVASGRRPARRRSVLLAVEFAVRGKGSARAPVSLAEITVDENPPIIIESSRLERHR